MKGNVLCHIGRAAGRLVAAVIVLLVVGLLLDGTARAAVLRVVAEVLLAW